MQVSRVSNNYQNNYQPNFKGEAERKIFMRVMSTSGLKKALNASTPDNTQPLEDFFANAFVKLKKRFSKMYDVKVSNDSSFSRLGNSKNFQENILKFKVGEEKISVSFLENLNAIHYSEWTTFHKNLRSGKEITYLFGAANAGPLFENDFPFVSRAMGVYLANIGKKELKAGVWDQDSLGLIEGMNKYNYKFMNCLAPKKFIEQNTSIKSPIS
ncbi:MAG: hypothetical protein WCY19_03070 [Candidatus Gastranaerophilaceae bacterium]